MVHFVLYHKLEPLINEEKYSSFIHKIYQGYRREVQYHNDLHGIDVAQVANYILTDGGLITLAQLSKIDILSFLVAGACHDFAHDGFNNAFHVNAMTERAIRYNDTSVQEAFHVAESFAIMQREDCNFLEKLTTDEFKVFRKRMIGCILATDMAKHAADLSALKGLVESHGIKGGENAEMII